MSSLEYKSHIDGMRAIAVLGVIFYHLEIELFQGGYLGVDIFFVISGYLISSIILKKSESKNFSFKEFYFRRFKRLAPSLITVLFLSQIAGIILYSPEDLVELSKTTIAAVFSFSNIYFWFGSGYFEQESLKQPLLHTWSLGVEEQFYYFWPVILYFAYKMYEKHLLLVLISILFFSAVSFFLFESVINSEFGIGGRDTVFYLTPFRIFEFCFGAILTQVREEKIVKYKELFFLFGIAITVVALLVFNDQDYFGVVFLGITCLGACFLILTGENWLSKIFLSNSIMVYLGKISYPLYLLHWPVIVYGSYLLSGELTTVAKTLLFIVTVLTSSILYHFIESPIRYSSLNKFKFLNYPMGSLSTAFALLMIVSAVSVASGGMRWRVDSEIEIYNSTDLRKMEEAYCENYSLIIDESIMNCQSHKGEQFPSLYIWGSSVGRHLVPGLVEKYPNLNVYHDWMGACNPQSGFQGYTRIYRNEEHKKCNDRNYKLLEYFKQTSPTNILLSSRFQGKKVTKITDWLIKELEVYGHNVYVTGDVRRLANDPLECLYKPNSIAENCGNFKRGEAKKQKTFEKEMNKIGAKFIKLDDTICSSETCELFTGEGKLIYRDSGHLTTWGSIEVVEKAFSKILF